MSELVYAVITNIPKNYHSADLRNFFSEFIENNHFDCFHFRHRPEIRKAKNATNNDSPDKKCDSRCCVIRLSLSKLNYLFRKYSGKHWLDKNADTLPSKCFISEVIIDELVSDQRTYKTRQELNEISENRVSFLLEDLKAMTEFNPPSIMPNGNVGTPTSHFLELIRSCKMPARMIGKLGLTFPKLRGKGPYTNVPYNYGTRSQMRVESDNSVIEAHSGTGKRLTDYYIPPLLEDKSEKEQSESSEEDDDACEDWERHLSLHEDVTAQGRNKERLYEEKIELKWEKGGSGLVFYTDAQYWDNEKGDFDERTTDDWDVDMSIYYEKDAGDRDAKELKQMRLEKRRRKGIDETVFKKAIGNFEKYTKGIGRKVLQKHGWSEGQGLGRSVQGISEALENEGKHPKDKRGFGYHGEKLSTAPVKEQRKHFISTVYDSTTVEIIDPPD